MAEKDSLEEQTQVFKSTKYRPELDGLRALSIISILINHFNADLLPSGFLGVDIFFVISGFVISASLFNGAERSWEDYLLSFYAKRVKRIVPALIGCVVFFSIMACLFIPSGNMADSLKTGRAALLGLSNVFLLRTSTNYFGAPAELNLFTHTWSLGVEEQFYLVFPVLLGLVGFSRKRSLRSIRNSMILVSLLCIFSLLLFIYFAETRPSFAFYLVFPRFWELALGCITFILALKISPPIQKKLGELISNISILFLIAALFLGRNHQSIATVAVCLITAIVILSSDSERHLAKMLRSTWIVRVGLISYSLYLWHWPVVVLSRWTVGISKQTVPLQLLITFGMAIGSYRFIEKPLRHADWSKSRRVTIAYGIGALLASVLLITVMTAFVAEKMYLGVNGNVKFEQGAAVEVPTSCYHDAKAANDIPPLSCGLAAPSPPKGDVKANRKIFLLGDSHAIALLPMIKDFSKEKRVHLSFSFGHSCPIPAISSDLFIDCLDGSKSVLAALTSLVSPGDLVLIANAFEGYGLTRKAVDYRERVEYARKAIDGLARQLAAKHVRLLIFGSKPRFWALATGSYCIEEWFRAGTQTSAKCIVDREDQLLDRDLLFEAFNRIERENPNTTVVNLFNYLCPRKACVVYINESRKLLFTDSNHINPQFFLDNKSEFERILDSSFER